MGTVSQSHPWEVELDRSHYGEVLQDCHDQTR